MNTGVEHAKSKVKRFAFGAAAALALLGAGMSSAVFAAGAGDGSQASACGAVHGAFADTNGNFGFLGQVGGTPGYHNGAVGQDPGATGYNNSHTDCQS
jgi:hypothetical protein